MVKLYTLPTCPICEIIKTKLDDKNIKYEEASFEELAQQDSIFNRAPVLYIEADGERKYATSPSAINEWINSQEA